MSDNILTIDYYTDVLCIWAWISQRRVEELHSQFGEKIAVRHHYMDVFGDVPGKIQRQWQNKGSYEGFALHVHKAAAGFEEVPVNADIWHSVQPQTSANAHLYIKAIVATAGEAAASEFSRRLREAFFVEAIDIGCRKQLDELLAQQDIEQGQVKSAIDDGTAMAFLLRDYRNAHQLGLKGSPSYIMNNGRQTLYGNVGYRVLSANIEELLKTVEQEASWC